MKTIILQLALLTTVLLSSTSLFADIEGKTTVTNFDSANRPFATKTIAGSALQGSWTEAFIDAVQFANEVKSTLDGNPYAAYKAYNELNQFLDAIQDKASVKSPRPMIFVKGNQVVKQRITFSIFSDDDPINAVQVAYPDQGNFSSIFNVSYRQFGEKNKSVTLEYNPNRLPVGEYTFVFYGKERQCSICLSTSHVVKVHIRPNPRTCFKDRKCVAIDKSLDMKYLDLENLLKEEEEALKRANATLGANSAHQILNRVKRDLKVCIKRGLRGDALFRCEQRAEDIREVCASLSYAQRNQGVCNTLQRIRDTRRILNRDVSRLKSDRSRSACCVEINVGGGLRRL